MPDRTDARIRALMVELVEHAPEAPSFQQIEDRGITVDQPRRIRALMVGAIAVAGLALLGGVLLVYRPQDRSSRVRAGAPSTRTSLRASARPSTEPSAPPAAQQGAAAPIPSSVPHYTFAPDAPIPPGYSLTNVDPGPAVQKLPPGGTTYGGWSAHYNSPTSPGTIVLSVEVWGGDTSVPEPNTSVNGVPAVFAHRGEIGSIVWSPRPHVNVSVYSLRDAVSDDALRALAAKTVEAS
jgi:hypothetical protein